MEKSTPLTGQLIGYDPGGNACHGLAVLTLDSGIATNLDITTQATAATVLEMIKNTPALLGLGVDTLSCWHTGPSGWRPADLWLRQRCKPVSNSVMSPNGLAGSMGLNGMSVLIESRSQSGALPISETHPKVLYYALSNIKYDYAANARAMDAFLSQRLSIPVETQNDHEWDAVLSAYALLMGLSGQWAHDLHTLADDLPGHAVHPCGPTHYWWPE